MRDITPPRELKPHKRFFPEVGEEMINGDGIIRLMQQIDTPQAKAIYKAFRLSYSRIKTEEPELDDQKARDRAVIEAIESTGKSITMIKI